MTAPKCSIHKMHSSKCFFMRACFIASLIERQFMPNGNANWRRFEHHPGELLPSLAAQLERRTGDLSAKNLAVSAHALAKLQDAAHPDVQALLHAIAARSISRCTAFTPQVSSSAVGPHERALVRPIPCQANAVCSREAIHCWLGTGGPRA